MRHSPHPPGPQYSIECQGHYFEVLAIQNIAQLTLRQAEFDQQRISKVQTRYLAAIRSLAHIRRLNVPAVQINMAEQQVNMTG